MEGTLKTLKTEYASLHEYEEKQIEELKHVFVPKIKELRQQKSLYETELRSIPQKQKGIQVEIEEYADKAKQELDEKNKQQEIYLQDIAHRLLNAESEHAKITAEKEKQFDSEEIDTRKQVERLCKARAEGGRNTCRYQAGKTEIRK